MARSAAPLRIVSATPVYDPREPEEVLTCLFAHENELLAELARCRASIADARALYSRKHRLQINVGLDTLRRLFA